ncbi:Ig-like domain-containing protein [Colwellia sp. MB02u-9]|uniref:Ig-like domain-containing protein n=1 Tax=Colwellia sp. MB02u-9 TaxID=2759823 RepID=UPI0015F4C64D|nr:Ig-like domain-containing protein [Colwellia sp. MB02u-9]MBA6295999.1 cadherin-like domain-containing protein [Colwellia sp. MB02u-9]
MKKQLLLSMLALSIITGCGGSDKSTKTTTPPPPESNTAPIANADTGLAQNNKSSTLDVLANDTDSNGDTLTLDSITVQPQFGTVEIVDNALLFTPQTDYAGVDTLSYQISDGALTAEAEVNLTINHTMTIAGKVTDSPISNALVTIELDGQTYTATADSKGNYQLPITINNMQNMLFIKAQGSEINNQASVELVAMLGEVKNLLSSVDANKELTNQENNRTNVTHLSTATYLLAKDRNENQNIASNEQLEALKSDISAEDTLETAGFIKLLVDNPDFQIPEGESILSLLDSDDASSTTDAITTYLVANAYVDESGEVTEAYTQALDVAIAATVSDPDAVAQFTTEMFTDKTMLGFYGAKQGWLQHEGTGWHFNSNGTASNYAINYDGVDTKQADWTVTNGKLVLAYKNNEVRLDYFSYPFDSVTTRYGFEQSVQDKLKEAADNGVIGKNLEIEIHSGLGHESVTLLSKTDTAYQVNISGEFGYKMTPPEAMDWQGESPTGTEFINSTRTYVHNDNSLFAGKVLNGISGRWVMHFDYSIKDSSQQQVEGFFGDTITISETSATTDKSAYQFTPTLDDGTLTLTQQNISYKITPFKQSGKHYLAKIEQWVDGKLTYVVSSQVAKFDDSFTLYTDNLVTELPEIQAAFINGSIADQWDGDKLKLENIWGYKFNADGTFIRGITGELAEWNEHGVDHFNMGDDNWTWDVESNIVNLYKENSYQTRHRTWEVISVDDMGRAIVLEYSTIGYDGNSDGVVSEDEIGQLINPRINILMKEDLSRWTEAWENTQNLGLTSASSTSNKIARDVTSQNKSPRLITTR